MFKKVMLALAAAVLLGGITTYVMWKNRPASVVISAPSEVKIGQLVRFDLSQSQGETFKWLVMPPTANLELYHGGRQACFSAEAPGEYTFIVACSYKGTVDVVKYVVRVGIIAPNPVVETIEAKVKTLVSQLTSPSKKAEALKLANSFNGIAAQINSGALTTPEEIIAKTAMSNRDALGPQLTAWTPFLMGLQADMKLRSAAGTLVTPAQHATLWTDIAKVLTEIGN